MELAARIGQSLLKKNKVLSDRNELLEAQIEHIREEVQTCMFEGFYVWSVKVILFRKVFECESYIVPIVITVQQVLEHVLQK